METAKFIRKDQNWDEETTTYYFQLQSAEKEFDNTIFGIVDNAGQTAIVDSDGVLVIDKRIRTAVLEHVCKITSEIIFR